MAARKIYDSATLCNDESLTPIDGNLKIFRVSDKQRKGEKIALWTSNNDER